MDQREVVFLNSVFFVLGFTLVFSLIGIALQTVLLNTSFGAMEAIRTIGGLIIIAFGILMLASAKWIIPFFSTEHKLFHAKRFNSSYLSSLLFGVGFALGWTPCVGAILGSIYTLAASTPGLAFFLLLTFSIGLGLPFLVFGAFLSEFRPFLKRVGPALKYFNIVGGIFLIIIGLMVVTGYIGMLSVFLDSLGTASVGNNLNFFVAFIAGLLTFFSPCILPLLPAYISYMAGTTAEGAEQ